MEAKVKDSTDELSDYLCDIYWDEIFNDQCHRIHYYSDVDITINSKIEDSSNIINFIDNLWYVVYNKLYSENHNLLWTTQERRYRLSNSNTISKLQNSFFNLDIENKTVKTDLLSNDGKEKIYKINKALSMLGIDKVDLSVLDSNNVDVKFHISNNIWHKIKTSDFNTELNTCQQKRNISNDNYDRITLEKWYWVWLRSMFSNWFISPCLIYNNDDLVWRLMIYEMYDKDKNKVLLLSRLYALWKFWNLRPQLYHKLIQELMDLWYKVAIPKNSTHDAIDYFSRLLPVYDYIECGNYNKNTMTICTWHYHPYINRYWEGIPYYDDVYISTNCEDSSLYTYTDSKFNYYLLNNKK